MSDRTKKLIENMIALIGVTNDGTTADPSSYFSVFFKDPNPRRAGFKRLAFGVVLGCMFVLSVVINYLFHRIGLGILFKAIVEFIEFPLLALSTVMSTWGMGSVITGRRWDQMKRWQQIILLLLLAPPLAILYPAICIGLLIFSISRF